MKNSYRKFFANVKQYIKIKYFLDRNNINQSQFSRFMKGQAFDYEMSMNKLELLYTDIMETIKSLHNIHYLHKILVKKGVTWKILS